jgi:HK97 family phage portal protein
VASLTNLARVLTRPFRSRTASSLATAAASGGGGFYTIDGFLPQAWGQFANFWQMGYDPIGGGGSAIVEACVSAYAQTIAMCPGAHKRTLENGGTQIVTTSALARLLRSPNSYQTPSDFKLNTVRSLLLDGNAYAIAVRNNRFEIAELHLMPPRSCSPIVDQATGEIYYQVTTAPFGSAGYSSTGGVIFPARDVLHVKLNALEDALVGRSPLTAAALELAASGAMKAQLAAFFSNMSRPSGVLRTEANLTADQVGTLRDRWNEQSQGMNAGKVPILTNGLQWQALSVTAQDAQVVEALKMTKQDVAMVFGVPLAMVNDMTGANYSNTESMMNFWLSKSLGFQINHLEEAIDKLFDLPADEYTEFDTSALLRSNFKDRIDALARGVQGGILAPNEARGMEGLAKAKEGDEPRVQQQVVPLSAWAKAPPAAPVPAAPKPPPPPAAEPPKPKQLEQEEVERIASAALHELLLAEAA